MSNLSKTIDALGQIKAQIAALKTKEDELKAGSATSTSGLRRRPVPRLHHPGRSRDTRHEGSARSPLTPVHCGAHQRHPRSHPQVSARTGKDLAAEPRFPHLENTTMTEQERLRSHCRCRDAVVLQFGTGIHSHPTLGNAAGEYWGLVYQSTVEPSSAPTEEFPDMPKGQIIWKNRQDCVIDTAAIDPSNEPQLSRRLLTMIEEGIVEAGDTFTITVEE